MSGLKYGIDFLSLVWNWYRKLDSAVWNGRRVLRLGRRISTVPKITWAIPPFRGYIPTCYQNYSRVQDLMCYVLQAMWLMNPINWSMPIGSENIWLTIAALSTHISEFYADHKANKDSRFLLKKVRYLLHIPWPQGWIQTSATSFQKLVKISVENKF